MVQSSPYERPVRFRLSGADRRRIAEGLWALADPCRLCPRRCGVARLSGRRGVCRAGPFVEVAWYGPHLGEEPPVSGTGGAGTVFFVGCPVGCPYCQNRQISRPTPQDTWPIMDARRLADVYLELQARGCHNIEWVTPSQALPTAVEALFLADEEGLDLPVVYNTGGYEDLEVLHLLDGVVDVYLPDLKHGPGADPRRVGVPRDYFEVAVSALREMGRQVGPLVLDERGVAVRGVLVRHMVLPGELADTPGVFRTVEQVLGRTAAVSLLGQYFPPRPGLAPPLDRTLDPAEYREALWLLESRPFAVRFYQDLASAWCLVPDFRRRDPFAGDGSADTGRGVGRVETDRGR